MKRQHANAILTALAAFGGSVVAYSIPVRLYEVVLSTTGFSEILPAAAPPLGGNARMLIVIAIGLLSAGIVAALLPGGKPAAGSTSKGTYMSFVFARLGTLVRGRKPTEQDGVEELRLIESEQHVVLRRSDAHPDAPPREPLSARRDLGEEALPPVIRDEGGDGPQTAVPEPIVRDITGQAMPRAPEPLPWEDIQAEMDRLLHVARERDAAFARYDDIVPADQGDDDPEREPTITELADRLERGLARRRALAADTSFDRQAVADRLEDVAVMMAGAGVSSSPSPSLPGRAMLAEGLEEALAALRSPRARTS